MRSGACVRKRGAIAVEFAILLPVVENDFDTHDDTPILAFVPFNPENSRKVLKKA